MTKKVLFLGLAALLVLAPAGCGSDNDNNDPDDDGVVTLYAESSDASSTLGPQSAAADELAGLQALVVRFAELDLRRTDGTIVNVIDDDDDADSIDLVVALASPTPLGALNVPPGDYNGAEGEIDVVQITDASGATCLVEDDFDFGPLLFPQTITVDDSGAISIVIEFPVIGGVCEGPEGDVEFGDCEARLYDDD